MSHEGRREQDDHDRGIRNEERLCQIDQKWIAHAEVHELEAQALRLQHTEYERRLETLNHEAARIAGRDAAFVPREVYDSDYKEVIRRLELATAQQGGYVTREVYDADAGSLRDKVQLLDNWKNKATGAAVILTLIAGAVGAAIAKALGT